MCAGIADKAGYTPAQVCSEEIEEEVGYAVPPEQLLPITAFISSAGITGATQHTFYAQVGSASNEHQFVATLHDWTYERCDHCMWASAMSLTSCMWLDSLHLQVYA